MTRLFQAVCEIRDVFDACAPLLRTCIGESATVQRFLQPSADTVRSMNFLNLSHIEGPRESQALS